MDQEEYQKQYDAAAAELEAAAQATTARGADGRFAKASPEPAPKEPAAPEVKADPAVPEEKPEEPPKVEEKPDPLADLRARLEKAEKIARDNQAWATRLSQERAQEKREREQREREANKPAILDANPELADAIRYVAQAPAEQPDHKAQFFEIVDRAHPGIFSKDIDPDLEKGVLTRVEALSEAERNDPLVFIREVTQEKLAHAERQLGKRFAAESAKLAQKSAMSVPGAGAGSGAKQAPVDAQLAEVQRIQSLSDAEFQKEVRRVKGY